MDVDDLSYLIKECASLYNLDLDFQNLVEILKAEVLSCRTTFSSNSNDKQKDRSQITDNDCQSFSEVEIDSIIGRTYTTRGIKRSYEEDSISVEPNRNVYRQNKQIKDKRDLLHLKDTYHLTDCAFNAIFQFIQSKKKALFLNRVGRLRKETNSKFPMLFTKTSVYVRFEYAVRTAISVAP
jgi:hypothetical protein